MCILALHIFISGGMLGLMTPYCLQTEKGCPLLTSALDPKFLLQFPWTNKAGSQ